mgnify:CR=1 FL=1
MSRPLPTDVRLSWMLVAAGRPFPVSSEHMFKPYVYKGTGEDTLTAHLDQPKPRAKPKPLDPERVRAANIKRHGAKRPGKPKKYKKRKRHHVWTPAPAPVAEPKFPTEVPALPPRKPRPAPGWEPMSGAELLDLMEEL